MISFFLNNNDSTYSVKLCFTYKKKKKKRERENEIK